MLKLFLVDSQPTIPCILCFGLSTESGSKNITDWYSLWQSFYPVLFNSSVFFFNLVPSSEETSFLTTFYGLYFSHHYTHFTHYKSCWTFHTNLVSSKTHTLMVFKFELLNFLFSQKLTNSHPCWDLNRDLLCSKPLC